MGWWKMNCNGGIDSSHKSESCGLVNAIPGEMHIENHVNGDGPADILCNLAAQLSYAYIEVTEKVPYKKYIQDLIGFPPDFRRDRLHLLELRHPGLGERLNNLIENAWGALDQEYQDVWGRPPYPEERNGAFNFIRNGINPEECNEKFHRLINCVGCGCQMPYLSKDSEECYTPHNLYRWVDLSGKRVYGAEGPAINQEESRTDYYCPNCWQGEEE